jgi:hypothetical protein
MKTTLQVIRYKRGVVVKHAHFLPHIASISMAALETAPPMEDGEVWVTEMYRDIKDDLDFHRLCAAIDFRCKSIIVRTGADTDEARALARIEIGQKWAERMSAMLGPDYDCIAHGSGDNFHLHVEFDPR